MAMEVKKRGMQKMIAEHLRKGGNPAIIENLAPEEIYTGSVYHGITLSRDPRLNESKLAAYLDNLPPRRRGPALRELALQAFLAQQNLPVAPMLSLAAAPLPSAPAKPSTRKRLAEADGFDE
jgi:hypothetical protein